MDLVGSHFLFFQKIKGEVCVCARARVEHAVHQLGYDQLPAEGSTSDATEKCSMQVINQIINH